MVLVESFLSKSSRSAVDLNLKVVLDIIFIFRRVPLPTNSNISNKLLHVKSVCKWYASVLISDLILIKNISSLICQRFIKHATNTLNLGLQNLFCKMSLHRKCIDLLYYGSWNNRYETQFRRSNSIYALLYRVSKLTLYGKSRKSVKHFAFISQTNVHHYEIASRCCKTQYRPYCVRLLK